MKTIDSYRMPVFDTLTLDQLIHFGKCATALGFNGVDTVQLVHDPYFDVASLTVATASE